MRRLTPIEKACPLTGQPMRHVFSQQILGKHHAEYFYCDETGFLAIKDPHWLDEAYSDAIVTSDTGILVRNAENARTVLAVLGVLGLQTSSVVDAAGGYGILTRLLRDAGVDCYSTDKYCANLFAGAFEPSNDTRAVLVCAFEALEHMPDGKQFLQELSDRYQPQAILLSTETFEQIPSQDWWYYAFDEGQHIAFYQPRTIGLLASSLGYTYHPLSSRLHLLVRGKSSIPFWLKYARIRNLYSSLVRRNLQSKTWSDHEDIKRSKGK